MRVCFLLFSLSLLILSCASNRPTLLVSPIQSKWQPTINPSSSIPQKGFHPSIGVSVGNGEPAPFNNSYRYINFGLNGGLLYQTSLEKETSIGYFASANAFLDYSGISFNPDYDSRDKMSLEEEKLFSNKTDAFTSEICFRGGLIGKLPFGTLAFYGQGFAQYETGQYYVFRKKVDNIGNYYNLSTEQSTLGYGFGADLCLGQISDFNIGILYEINYVFMESESFESTYIDDYEDLYGSYITKLSEDGKNFMLENNKIECYLEQDNTRVSLAMTAYDSTISLTYRW